MKSEDVFPVVVGVFGIFAVIYTAFFLVLNANGELRCLQAGWRDNSTAWNLSRYCVARTDQTDVVKPLRWAEEHPR